MIDGRGTACNLTDEQIVAALAVEATASGAATLLSSWNERRISADDVLQRVAASPRLQRVAAFCAKAQGRRAVAGADDRVRALAGLRRRRELRSRK